MSNFSNIDKKIQEFKINKPGISIVDKPKSDWFIFSIVPLNGKKINLILLWKYFPTLMITEVQLHGIL